MTTRRSILHAEFRYNNAASHSDPMLFRVRMRERREQAQRVRPWEDRYDEALNYAAQRLRAAVEPAGELADVARIGRKL